MNEQETLRVMQYGSRRDILAHLNDLNTAFDTYNRNVSNSSEVISILINFALDSTDEEITNELLEVICLAQTTQDIGGVDYAQIATNINSVSEKFLPKFIEILSYTYDARYLPVILEFKNHKKKDVRQAVKDALFELNASDQV